MLNSANHRGLKKSLAPAAALLLALLLLAVGAQAVPEAVDSAGLTPYPGPYPVPGYVQAEDFDLGGEGVAYHDLEPANLGGAYRPAEGVDIETGQYVTNVGWIRSGEWLSYTLTATEPQPVYLLLSAANPDATTKRVTYSLNGTIAGTVDVHPTGGFEQYNGHISTPFTFPAGETVLRLSFDGVGRINLDTFGLESMGPTPAPTPAPEVLIDTPGLHTLDRDLTTGWLGVMINSSDVVLDGMGHTIEGTKANSTGVYASGTPSLWSSGVLTNVTIRNLTVRDCGAGITLGGVSGAVLEDVVAERNVVGLEISGGGTTNDHLVRDSVFRENSRVGISAGYPA
ncbi:MAG: carbohydrate-binding protein [Methanospirillum sp.]|nr:carbohydrate-binding protein [Methanospirillum sp.]